MQGFNMGRYVPPELEGVKSANQVSNKHALGARASKIKQGILTVRFEMPFPIWCSTCLKPTIIGQGVRFNAEKKKVGKYHTTPIYSFRMKHVVCGGWIEIRTDPKNTAYVVAEGAKKMDTGEDKVEEGEFRIRTEEERERLEADAFAALEGKMDDKRQVATDKSRIEELWRTKERDWDDPGEANRRLRKTFRVGRKMREKDGRVTEGLKDRMSLGIDLLEETEEDRRRAGFVEFGEVGGDGAVRKAQSRPLFTSTSDAKKPLSKRLKTTKAASEAESRRNILSKELGDNTRAALDPFLNAERITPTNVPLIKRRKISSHSASVKVPNHGPSLVDYESD